MGVVDQAFIQAQEHRPAKSFFTYAEGIPLIDLSSTDGLVSEIGNACKNWGFFQVVNHGVPLEKRQKLVDSSIKFFGLPLEEKRKIRRNEKQVLGYHDTEHTKNVRDWKEVFDFTAKEPYVLPASYEPHDEELVELNNVWPQDPPELKEASEEYVKEMEKLAFKLLELIALSLGLPANRFHSFFREQTTRVKLHHYPQCPAPELALGLGSHKDSGGLTILFQDEAGGLQVKSKSDGEWVAVKPIPDTYIVNVGEVIQVWSNEAYESVEHRVMVNSEKERYSIPYFFNPAHYTMVEPLEELTNEQNPPKYKAYNWGKFTTNRRLSNFMKRDVEDIQISQFKIY
ncbi:hypothetical protein LWI28_011989 [Acer negundo]|uniref:Fe2OG dioxygenase domain-containing protein n=1 Tax=Acer negundo TaxID=4023 RepID=A0AAD5IZP7_ACENE|nr:hypothetical protein LWI28_011989 [Acer negundo]KAK4847590.1 hypothetical protein QYF36_003641 [Acer negundo]